MNSRQKLSKFQQQLATKYADFSGVPEKALEKVNCVGQWEVDQHFAITLLYKSVAETVAIALFNGFVRQWDRYYLDKPVVMATEKQRQYWDKKHPNRWLRERIKMIKRGAKSLPVALGRLKSKGLREMEAQVWALKCTELARECAQDGLPVADVLEEVQTLADKWGFKPSPSVKDDCISEGESLADYQFRIAEDSAWLHLDYLLDEAWWSRRIEIAYRQFCEHCQIIAGRVHKGASECLSMNGRADYKARQDASILAMSQLVAKNEETGEEVAALDILNASTANPKIKRCEFMVRSAGFEAIAQELGLIGGFFTITAPSRFHAFTSTSDNKKAYDNTKYKGATPKQTQKYLSKIWARARAKLNRMNIHIFGFRVCEPHHDGTPHWHALFFFKPDDEQAIRFVLADYFTQEDRDELHVNRADFKAWGKSIKEGLTTKNMFSPEKVAERKHIYSISKRIKRRFDYKFLDPKKGSATAYIAKYIAKNIDGFQLSDDQDTGTPADVKARAVRGWASLWNVRQFQQVGGASVTVWRELRKLEMTEGEVTEMKARKAAELKGVKHVSIRKIESFYDLQKQHDSIEVARISANKGSWSMYIQAMGGIFCPRKDHPVKMAYKDAMSARGEAVKKVKGVVNDAKTMITRSGSWIFTHKSAEKEGFKTGPQGPWSSDTNCTVSINEDEKQEVSNLLKERSEAVNDEIIGSLLTFKTVVISERWAGDEKRTVWGKLKRNVLNIGGNFRLKVWEERVKRNVTYIDPPAVRFEVDPTGRKSSVFDSKPLADDLKGLRAERQAYPFAMTWEEFEENVARNGEYIAPDDSEEHEFMFIYSRFKKDEITEVAFVEYMNKTLHFHDKYGVNGSRAWRFGEFSEFTNGVEPFTAEFNKRVRIWGRKLLGKEEKKKGKTNKKVENTYSGIVTALKSGVISEDEFCEIINSSITINAGGYI